jgi:hypothetical protein
VVAAAVEEARASSTSSTEEVRGVERELLHPYVSYSNSLVAGWVGLRKHLT